MALSFEDDSVAHVLLTSDVFEHVADPYRAHAEVRRVLRPGGVHVFTIPFLETAYRDEVRADVDEAGEIVHLAEPVYHADPASPVPGALVFTYFSLEMLVRLDEIGFDTEMYCRNTAVRRHRRPRGHRVRRRQASGAVGTFAFVWRPSGRRTNAKTDGSGGSGVRGQEARASVMICSRSVISISPDWRAFTVPSAPMMTKYG